MKVFVISQFGDLPLFYFVFLMLNRFGTTDMGVILSQANLSSFDFVALPFCGILINFNLAASIGLSFALFLKAAQFVFYPWLLDAMEAPVPISAQLHSSTLVIIGFYVVLRFQPFIANAPQTLNLFLIFGTITVVGASVLGYYQDDGKKLLACSTASQLGYAVVGLGLNLFEETMLLLMFCCCNKALTFIWFGALMDRFNGVSDFRLIGGAGNLSTVEHAGLFTAIANFTIAPGAFSWHVKALFLRGQYVSDSLLQKYALDVLSLTWFFSSLYLIALYLTLFVGPTRRADNLNNQEYSSSAPIFGNFNVFTSPKNTIIFWLPKMSTSVSNFFFFGLIFTLTILIAPELFISWAGVDFSWVIDFFSYANYSIVSFYGA